jgi:hypothetical protein
MRRQINKQLWQGADKPQQLHIVLQLLTFDPRTEAEGDEARVTPLARDKRAACCGFIMMFAKMRECGTRGGAGGSQSSVAQAKATEKMASKPNRHLKLFCPCAFRAHHDEHTTRNTRHRTHGLNARTY